MSNYINNKPVHVGYNVKTKEKDYCRYPNLYHEYVCFHYSEEWLARKAGVAPEVLNGVLHNGDTLTFDELYNLYKAMVPERFFVGRYKISYSYLFSPKVSWIKPDKGRGELFIKEIKEVTRKIAAYMMYDCEFKPELKAEIRNSKYYRWYMKLLEDYNQIGEASYSMYRAICHNAYKIQNIKPSLYPKTNPNVRSTPNKGGASQ